MKHNSTIALLTVLLSASVGFAAKVAVVDSGGDFEHERLVGHQSINGKEIPGNLVDDDRNGKVDDVAGWNFAEGYSKTFFPGHESAATPFTFKLFEILASQQAGNTSDADTEFWRQNVTSLNPNQKKSLLTHLNFYGQYAHGTHCTGIVLAQAPEAKILTARVFPDSPPEAYVPGRSGMATLGLSDFLYGLLAKVQTGMFKEVGLYLKENDVAVANYSLGVPLSQIAKQFLALRGIANPTEAQLSEETTKAFKKFEPFGKEWMASSPGTLFVIAAGNDGTDNDKLPTFPANVRMPNAITVAAVYETASLAKFSNTGKLSVDVAAPGVAVKSSVPSVDHKRILPMSGTSMAAPFVTGVAAHVKDLNPALTAEQIKAILMGTVDVKPWLKDKVVTGGLINKVRAFLAAEKTHIMPVDQAIAAARAEVADQPETTTPMQPLKTMDPEMKAFADALVF